MQPLISIIIPVYNVQSYLRKCLDSIVNQASKLIEVICVNDGSTDSSGDILDKYAQQFKYIKVYHVQNGGTAQARNIGLSQSIGVYLWFIDSDDWIETGSLETLRKLIELDKSDVISFNGVIYDESTSRFEIEDPIKPEKLKGWEYYSKYALVKRKFHFVCVVLRLYRREFLLDNQLVFDKSIFHEDNLWIPKVFYYANSVTIIDDRLYFYRIHNSSKMYDLNSNKLIDIVKIANKLSAFFVSKTDIDKQTIYREIAGEYFKGFMQEELSKYGNNDKELSRQINWEFFRLVSVYPRHRRIFWLLRIHPVLFRFYLKIEDYLKVHILM